MNEIELKLAVSEQIGRALPQLLANLSEQGLVEIKTQGSQFLANAYYDTPDQWLASQKMGLRLRQQDAQFVMTLKTNGEVLGGLHSRPEYNLPCASQEPDWAGFAAHFELPWLAKEQDVLKKFFATDFQRQTWLLDYQGAQIELAFDLGEVKTAQKSQPICEIEFELKQGEPWHLLAFANVFLAQLAQESAPQTLHFDSVSKAQRGYRLLQNNAPLPKNWLDQWRAVVDLENENFSQKMTAVCQLEQSLIEETLAFGADFFAQDFVRTVERIGAFFNLYHFYSENGRWLEQVANAQLARGAHLAQDILLKLQQSNQKLLAEIRELIGLHSQNKDNLAAMQRLIGLLQTPSYGQRMLDLISLAQ